MQIIGFALRSVVERHRDAFVMLGMGYSHNTIFSIEALGSGVFFH